jgi:chaperonin GroES
MDVDGVAMNPFLRYDVDVSTLFPRVLINVAEGKFFHQERRNSMAAKLQPLADRVLVKPIEKEEKTKSGIYLPDTAKEKPQEGEVLAVGPGKMSDDGKRIAMDLKVGDIVIYAKYGGTEVKIDDEELILLRESDILAKKSK